MYVIIKLPTLKFIKLILSNLTIISYIFLRPVSGVLFVFYIFVPSLIIKSISYESFKKLH